MAPRGLSKYGTIDRLQPAYQHMTLFKPHIQREFQVYVRARFDDAAVARSSDGTLGPLALINYIMVNGI